MTQKYAQLSPSERRVRDDRVRIYEHERQQKRETTKKTEGLRNANHAKRDDDCTAQHQTLSFFSSHSLFKTRARASVVKRFSEDAFESKFLECLAPLLRDL